MLGKERFDAALRAFGFGAPTALDFPGEASGHPAAGRPVQRARAWHRCRSGNGIAVTAMQMLDVYMTIANDGVARPPRLVAATIDADGERHEAPLGATPARRVGRDGARDAHDARSASWPSGTGTKAQIPGYTRRRQDRHGAQAAVRRTAVPVRGVVRRLRAGRVAAPRGDRRARRAAATNYYGGQVAAPVFARIMQYALAVERVPAARRDRWPRRSAAVTRRSAARGPGTLTRARPPVRSAREERTARVQLQRAPRRRRRARARRGPARSRCRR